MGSGGAGNNRLYRNLPEYAAQRQILTDYQKQLDITAQENITAQKIEYSSDSFNLMKRNIMSSEVKIFRVLKCWNPDLMRMEINIVDQTAAHAASKAVVEVLTKAASAVQKQSQAPKGKLERKLKKWLEAATSKKDKMDIDDFLA